jgi:ADP-ribosylation factor GTPase-activating protein 2/3
MGVHVSFVRSVDLDEWTQRQIDAMRLGGNGNAREYFRHHGFTDLLHKVEKKYKCKAAVSYRAELTKLVNAEAVKRGEVIDSGPAEEGSGSNLLESLAISDQKQEQELARQKLAEARSGSAAGVLHPSAKLAASMPGASRLSVASGGLRKPGTSSGSTFNMKKKPTSKLRVNKLSVTTSKNEEEFEDIETTQKTAIEAEREAKEAADKAAQAKLEAALALTSMNGTSNGTHISPAPVSAPVKLPPTTLTKPLVEKPVVVPPPEPVKKPTLQDNMSRLQAMNKDFFSDI